MLVNLYLTKPTVSMNSSGRQTTVPVPKSEPEINVDIPLNPIQETLVRGFDHLVLLPPNERGTVTVRAILGMTTVSLGTYSPRRPVEGQEYETGGPRLFTQMRVGWNRDAGEMAFTRLRGEEDDPTKTPYAGIANHGEQISDPILRCTDPSLNQPYGIALMTLVEGAVLAMAQYKANATATQPTGAGAFEDAMEDNTTPEADAAEAAA